MALLTRDAAGIYKIGIIVASESKIKSLPFSKLIPNVLSVEFR